MKKFLILFFTVLMCANASFARDFRFVQVSDVRYSANDNADLLKKTIADINKQKDVEFVIFSGDNIGKPSAEDLKSFLQEVKSLKVPFYLVIGDKDVNKHKHLSKVEYINTVKKQVRKYKPEKPSYVIETKDLVFLVVDGAKEVIPGSNGYYRDDVLEWLDKELSAHAAKKAVIVQHFPLIPPSNKETYYTFKPENYLSLLAKHQNVIALFAGHFGVNSEKNVDGILHVSTSGAPHYRVIDILDCETKNPMIWAQLRTVE